MDGWMGSTPGGKPATPLWLCVAVKPAGIGLDWRTKGDTIYNVAFHHILTACRNILYCREDTKPNFVSVT